MLDGFNATDLFGLTPKQVQLMFSLEEFIIQGAVAEYKDDKKIAGNLWNYEWLKENNDALKELGDTSLDIKSNEMDIKKLIAEIQTTLQVKTVMYLILLECCLFQPFYPLDEFNYDENIKKNVKKLKHNKAKHKTICMYIASMLGIKNEYVLKFLESYNSAINKLTDYWIKVLVGVLMGVAAGIMVVGMKQTSIVKEIGKGAGRAGAAAYNHGMAILGGGTVAEGGGGVARGLKVLIGGASILGAFSGGSLGVYIASNPAYVLSEQAKLQVVIKEIVLGMQADFSKVQEILAEQNKAIFELKQQISEEKRKSERNSQLIKKLEESLKYMEKNYKECWKMSA